LKLEGSYTYEASQDVVWSQKTTTTKNNPAPKPMIPPPKPPTQKEFVVGVAKNMIDDLIPPEKRPILMALVASCLGIVLLMWWFDRQVREFLRP
jgi:hypothetical protein